MYNSNNPIPNQQVTGVPSASGHTQMNSLTMMFIAGAFIAALNCFARADYNLPLFIYCILVTGQQTFTQEIRTIYLLIFSQVVDFLFIVYWGSSISVFSNDNLSWLHSTYVFTLILTSILLLLKFGILFRLMSENKIIEQVSIGGAITNLTEFFSAKNNGYSQGVPAGMNNLGAPAGYSHQ